MTGEKNPWPGKKKCALMLCFDLDGKSIWQNKIRSMPGWTGFLKGPSVGQYGPNRGADRIMNILEKYGLKATFFVPASVMKENPDVVRRMVEQGHEVAHHGLYHEDSYGDTVEEQLALLEESQQIFRDVIGKPASGFRCTGSLLPGTQKALYSDPNTLYTMFNTGKELPGNRFDTCLPDKDFTLFFAPVVPKKKRRSYSEGITSVSDTTGVHCPPVIITLLEIKKYKNISYTEVYTMDCLFCKIIAGEIPSSKVYEDEKVYAFRDINPQAPVHVLVVPKEHIAGADSITAENSSAVAAVFEAIPKIADLEGLTNGYRVITNCGEDGCQSVRHLHFHLVGGKKLPESMA